MRYLVRVKELKLKIDYYKTLLDEIKENIRILNETKTTIVWEGQARITFNNYYDDYIKELYVMVYKITLLINFLSSYLITQITLDLCPSKVCTHFFSFKFQIFIVLSKLPEAK